MNIAWKELRRRPARFVTATGILTLIALFGLASSASAETLAPLKVLFVGNSITLHGPKADIDWHGNWGMAATSADKDYVHLVTKALAARQGRGAAPERQVAHADAVQEPQAVLNFTQNALGDNRLAIGEFERLEHADGGDARQLPRIGAAGNVDRHPVFGKKPRHIGIGRVTAKGDPRFGKALAGFPRVAHAMNAGAKPQLFGEFGNAFNSGRTKAVIGDDSVGVQRFLAGLKLWLYQQHVIGLRSNRHHLLKHQGE